MRLTFWSRSDPFEVAFFRMGKWTLGFLGFWPLDPINRSTIIKGFINLSILLTAIIGELRFTWLMRREPIEALAAICPCLTKMVTLMKLVCFAIYRKEFAKLLNKLLEHLGSDTKDSQKNAMIGRVSFFTTMWCMWLYFIAISTNLFYSIKPLIVWAYRRFTRENDTWVSLPFPAALPYKDMTQLQDKTLYSSMYCLLAYSGNVTIFGFAGVDGTFMCFCMYISVSYQCLQEDFQQAFKKCARRVKLRLKTPLIQFYGVTRSDLLYNELSVLIKRQQNITTIFSSFNRVYKFMILVHFLFAGIVLGVALINILLTPGLSKSLYMIYAMGACSQLYTYCYGAENLNASASKLYEDLYFCEWYKYDNRVRKLILFIMVKSQRGSLLSVPFFSPSIPLFAAIIKTSGTYFTLLKALF